MDPRDPPGEFFRRRATYLTVDGIPVRPLIESFLARCREPVLLEPGEDPIPLGEGSYELSEAGGRLQIHAWTESRNLVRRVTAIRNQARGKLELAIARFGRREGVVTLADLAAPENHAALLKSERLKHRDAFGVFLARQFPGWEVAELTAGRDLERSLPDTHPRALLVKGRHGIAAIAAGNDPAGTLAYGLLWLAHLRRREPQRDIPRLVLLLPRGEEGPTCWRISHLTGARFEVFAASPSGFAEPVDLADLGNLHTQLEPCQRGFAAVPDELRAVPGVVLEERRDGSIGLSVAGFEFARVAAAGITAGLETRAPASAREAAALGRSLGPLRSALPRRAEKFLESVVRANIEEIDAELLPDPVYGQVPEFTAGDRGVMDLLACDRAGRLAVLELKATQDLHLPLQALDYWMRVQWHLQRGNFTTHGYFPGLELRRAPPKLYLVAPAIEFHPANETILRFFASGLEVEYIGLGLEWQKRLKVVFRRGRT